jgi:hypothetical protein
MNKRGVSELQIEDAILRHDSKGPAKRAGATRLEKKLGKHRRLVVIVEEGSSYFSVVTAYWRKAQGRR